MKKKLRVPNRLFQFYYDQYKWELDNTDKLYTKCGVMFIALQGLWTIAAVLILGRFELLTFANMGRSAIFLYWVFLGLVVLCSTASTFYLFMCGYPRRRYKCIRSTKKWIEHQGRNGLSNSSLVRKVVLKLADAQDVNARINKKRLIYFQNSFMFMIIAFGFLLVTSFLYLLT